MPLHQFWCSVFLSRGRALALAGIDPHNYRQRSTRPADTELCQCLNVHLFSVLRHARDLIAAWREDYNHHRPQTSLAPDAGCLFGCSAGEIRQPAGRVSGGRHRKTRKLRIAVAEAQFQQAQLNEVNDTLALTGQTQQAWINAVAALERLSNLGQSGETAAAGADLASQLGKTGALNKAGQAREYAFNAELAGQVARARLEAQLAKEELTRLMGLWGSDANYYVPDALPPLPKSLPRVASIEAAALRNRVDLKVAKLGLEARAFGLTDRTRLVTDLELIAGVESEREREDGETETETLPQLELEFAIPVFDTGKARMACGFLYC